MTPAESAELPLPVLLDQLDRALQSVVDDELPMMDFCAIHGRLYWSHLLRLHDAADPGYARQASGFKDRLARHEGEVAQIVSLVCADDEVDLPGFVECGRIGETEALRQLKALVARWGAQGLPQAHSGRQSMQEKTLSNPSRIPLLAAGALLVSGALLHIATIFGGPAWYAFLGAPPRLVAMAASGSTRPAISCIVIAVILLICAAYAFSAAGAMRRLPALRAVLALVATGLLVRGVAFVAVAAWRPQLLAGVCGRCESVNAFLLITSALCLLVGAGLAFGAVRLPRERAINMRSREGA